MEVVIDQKGEETVIKIKGRLDTNTARECEEKVLPVWENPGVKVCVDCSDLEYVSSAGLRHSCRKYFRPRRYPRTDPQRTLERCRTCFNADS